MAQSSLSNPATDFILDMGKQALDAAVADLCRNNFLVFQKLEMGMEVGTHHREWWEILKTRTDCVFMSPRDHGKALWVETPILTKRGWTTHGDLKVGDYVRHPGGTWTKVIGVSERWTDRPTYRVKFRGTSESFICDENHLWRVKELSSVRRGTYVAETKKLAKRIRYERTDGTIKYDFNLRIKTPKSFEGKDKLVHPWALGFWLEKGMENGPYFESVGTAELRKLKFLLPDLQEMTPQRGKQRVKSAEFGAFLRRQKLNSMKRIPRAYQEASKETRLELLMGVFAGRGLLQNVNKVADRYTLFTVKEDYARALVELATGLGIRVVLRKVKKKHKAKRDRWELRFYLRGLKESTPTSLEPVKLEKQKSWTWRISSIKLMKSMETSCIQVEAKDGMYLVGRNLIPTHNSHSLARAYPIWKAKYDPWVEEIYILGADQPTAVENLDKIKILMASRPSLRSLLPRTRSEGLNSRTELRLMNGVLIKAKGFYSPLRGRHPQLIILDDVLNEKNSDTVEGRERTKEYFFKVVMPMKDKGTLKLQQAGYRPQVVVIGTAQNGEDLYHVLKEKPDFTVIKQKAILDEEKKTVLWPERYDFDSLMAIKKNVGTLVFSQEYQNEPLNDETSLFPMSLLETLKDETLSYQDIYEGAEPVFLGADFSVPGNSDGDWTVVFVASMNRSTGVYTPLMYWRAQPDDVQVQLRQVEYFCQAYGVSYGYVEDNMFQRIYAEHFEKKTNLPVKGNTVRTGNKNSLETGVMSFRPLFENRKFRFPYRLQSDQMKTDLIFKEFNGITKKNGRLGNQTFHDDVVLSMWHLLQASRVMTSFSYEF